MTFFFKELHGQVNFIENYLLSGNTFVENVAVEIGANSTNFSWCCSNGHGVDFLLVSGHDTIEHVSWPPMVDEFRQPAPHGREFRVQTEPSVALGHGGQWIVFNQRRWDDAFDVLVSILTNVASRFQYVVVAVRRAPVEGSDQSPRFDHVVQQSGGHNQTIFRVRRVIIEPLWNGFRHSLTSGEFVDRSRNR